MSEILLGKPLGKKSSENNQTKSRNYNLDSIRRTGLTWKLQSYREKENMTYSDDSHLITIAPTGTGKGRSAVIPNLLNYTGPVITIDPKGENYMVTSKRRKEMGQKVYKLDPFNIVDSESDGLNPMDIFALNNSELVSDAQMLSDLMSLDNTSSEHKFWDISACALLSGVIGYISSGLESEHRNYSKLYNVLHSDDVVYNLAVVLDTLGKEIHPMAYAEIASFLQKADKERSGVLSTATSYLKAFSSELVFKALDKSSFDLKEIVNGDPISIYIIIPPDKLRSHSSILRLWVGTFLKAIMSRKRIPKQRTLFILDECAQLGSFPFLESIITLSRGYGLQAWTFWQDLSQIKKLYDVGWSTMVNNCAVLQIFGTNNFNVALDCSELIGIDSDDIRDLKSSEQIVVINGKPLKSSKFDYLSDKEFEKKYSKNPYYVNIGFQPY
ncbi:type IV secretory system conjugative DNA transfer family protein [Flavivirga aquimarina]|uniref:Type IV secretory system conjugative DNA transfer family protein n=1 Tax=Flavivirga aquimarina TaxID=2027862 RepID=A0ABT8W6Y3_9FLAO|nr:type IV secretory system conjugative DNA transfer family protein [Flavivirga aquimarina]MDO5968870.1 type IV secretory system conjugative DNA transfer family protein [Flavivirga aquimarina]